MGCGASTSQGTAVPSVNPQAVNRAGSLNNHSSSAVPLAEDVSAVQDQEPRASAAGGAGPREPAGRGAGDPGEPKSQPNGSAADVGATRLVLGSTGGPTSALSASLDPAVTPTSQVATVTLLGGLSAGRTAAAAAGAAAAEKAGFNARTRYTNESDLSMASTSYDMHSGYDSEEDELAALFTLQAWKRYYGYNKRKHSDLLGYFWRKFNTSDYSLFCISYTAQDLFVAPFMAENVVNGYVARLEDLGLADQLFLQLYTLHDFECDLYRVVGLLMVQGAALPPQLQNLAAFDGFAYHRADTSVTLVKQFVSALLVGKSPVNTLQLLAARELL